jgi:hypothetical protein
VARGKRQSNDKKEIGGVEFKWKHCVLLKAKEFHYLRVKHSKPIKSMLQPFLRIHSCTQNTKKQTEGGEKLSRDRERQREEEESSILYIFPSFLVMYCKVAMYN